MWLFPHNGVEVGHIELAGGPEIGLLSASAERIVGIPPERPIATDDEFIEGALPRRHMARDQDSANEGQVPGLQLEVTLQGQPGQLGLFPIPSHTYRMVLWGEGRAFRGSQHKCKFRVPVAFASPVSHRSDGYLAASVERLMRVSKKHRAIELLKMLDSRIVNIEISTPAEFDSGSVLPRGSLPPALFIEYEGAGLVPIHAMGDGLRRALHLAIVLAEVDPGGVLLIDEIEVGMHTSVLSGVFDWIASACLESKVQLFATTHSLEAVDAMLEGADKENLVLYRIRD